MNLPSLTVPGPGMTCFSIMTDPVLTISGLTAVRPAHMDSYPSDSTGSRLPEPHLLYLYVGGG
jgi:hypothetical protein